MLEQSGDEAVGFAGEFALAVFVEENIFSILKEGHIRVHAGSVHPEDRLWHEGGVQAVALGDGFDGELEGHDVVGGGEGVGVFEINFVLAGGDFVVAGFDLKAHGFQRDADLAACSFAVVERAEIEIAGFVAGLGGWASVFVGVEEEKFAFWADVEGVAEFGGFVENVFQHVARIADEWGAVGIVDVADESGDALMLWSPWQDDEGVEIWVQILVGFVDACEAFDGAAVDHDLIVQCFFQLCAGDGNVFHLAKNIGELHADKFDVVFVGETDDVFFGIFIHGETPLLRSMSGNKRKKSKRVRAFRNTLALDDHIMRRIFMNVNA